MSEQTTALARRESAAIEPKTPRAIAMKQVLEEEREQRGLLRQYINEQMVDGTDYGKIPGTDKPTLLKPGAEKLITLFRCTPKFKLTKEEDFDRGFFNYTFRCQLVTDEGKVVAEGYGSANSKEGRYRWRNASRKCPACGKESIIKGKVEYGGGWLCFKKQGGCNAKFPDEASEIVGQVVGKVENDDIATLANTILKMAKKRAMVDASIALGRCSDVFTQDVEDLADPEHSAEPLRPMRDVTPEKPKQQTKPAPKAQQAPPRPQQQAPQQEEPPPPTDEYGPPPSEPPPPVEPKRAEPKKPTQDELRKVRAARAARLWSVQKDRGMNPAEFGSWARKVLRTDQVKPSKDWTDQDLDALEAAATEQQEPGSNG